MNDRQVIFEEECIRYDKTDASYNSAFGSSKDALLLFSEDKTIIDANEQFARLCLYDCQEVTGLSFETLFPGISEDSSKLPKNGMRYSCPLFSLQTQMRRKTGTDLPVEIFISPLPHNQKGHQIYQALVKYVVVPDLNNNKDKNNNSKLNSQRLKSIGSLAGGIAHHFNNIMTGLYGNITLARMEIKNNTEALSHLEKAEDSMEAAVKLTRQLLTFAKGGTPIKEKFDLAPLIQDTAELNLTGSNAKLNIDLATNLWPIHADKGQIEQVISNIVGNSREAMESGGVMSIRAENTRLLKDNLLTISKGAYIKLTFKDQGSGITQKDLNRIFDPYFTTKPNGCGMGLSICYSIVNKHKGHIFASSQLRTGTILTVYLPAESPEKAKEIAMTSETPGSDSQARILVMDDEEHIRSITKKMLEKFGYTVTLTEDGRQAVEEYKKAFASGTRYDLVILDLTIPGGMGGKEASQEILTLDPDAHVVVSSGYSNDPVMANYDSYGLKGIIPKPFRLAELKETVHKLLS
ncbi:MAG: response regulator [Desulfobacterales bacterium]|nr:response regulator [Desulfobacterales bacterium]